MIKEDEEAELGASLRVHIAEARRQLYDTLRAVCRHGEREDTEEFERRWRRYGQLLKAQQLLTDASA